MSIDKAVGVGLLGNELSKKITGTDEVSARRTAVAVSSGASAGAVAAGLITVGATTLGVTTAPITIPLFVAGGIIAGIASLFD